MLIFSRAGAKQVCGSCPPHNDTLPKRNMLAIWGPSKLHREMQACCIPELLAHLPRPDLIQVAIECQSADALAAKIDRIDHVELVGAAKRCILLTALVQVRLTKIALPPPSPLPCHTNNSATPTTAGSWFWGRCI